MNPETDQARPERDNTDTSLRTERKNTDQALVEQRTHTEEDADELVERAREKADAVLDGARDRADEKLDHANAVVEVRDAVVRERVEEDQVLQDERAAADETLRSEREQQTRTLAALLPLEREKTDRYLLTERGRSDEALANRDDFMGMVSHDLRNLLSGISMNASLLSEQVSGSDEGRRTLAGTKLIQRYVARMNRLIGDLVDVVSIDADKLAVQPVRGDAAALLTEAADAFAFAASDKGLTLKSEITDTLLAEFDHDRILQVLANLITNAIKFTPQGGLITVRGERDKDELRLSVQDTGPGIPSDMLEAVFERFWQVGTNDKRGLGLGLYISKCIVDAHGGRIWAESTLGDGSLFHVALPLAVSGGSKIAPTP